MPSRYVTNIRNFLPPFACDKRLGRNNVVTVRPTNTTRKSLIFLQSCVTILTVVIGTSVDSQNVIAIKSQRKPNVTYSLSHRKNPIVKRLVQILDIEVHTFKLFQSVLSHFLRTTNERIILPLLQQIRTSKLEKKKDFKFGKSTRIQKPKIFRFTNHRSLVKFICTTDITLFKLTVLSGYIELHQDKTNCATACNS